MQRSEFDSRVKTAFFSSSKNMYTRLHLISFAYLDSTTFIIIQCLKKYEKLASSISEGLWVIFVFKGGCCESCRKRSLRWRNTDVSGAWWPSSPYKARPNHPLPPPPRPSSLQIPGDITASTDPHKLSLISTLLFPSLPYLLTLLNAYHMFAQRKYFYFWACNPSF